MTHRSLAQLATKLKKDGRRGWLSPDGRFFESEETPAVRITGLSLGGHEQAAIQWLEENDTDLLQELEHRIEEAGYDCWIDTDGTEMIKGFMIEHGFKRIAPDES